MISLCCCCYNRLTKTICYRTKGTMIGADRINEIGLVNSHRGNSSAGDLTVNESSATIPDPVPDLVPFPEENRREDGKMSATLFQCGELMHICQGIMTHLTNETVETVEELNEDTIIDIDGDDADNNDGNNANNNTNQDPNEDDESTDGLMMSQVDQYDEKSIANIVWNKIP